jgi:hypothetical protein
MGSFDLRHRRRHLCPFAGHPGVFLVLAWPVIVTASLTALPYSSPPGWIR